MPAKPLLPLTYYGGKVNKTPWLLSLFPSAYDVYLEPFIGSGSVLAAKPRQGLEVINDLDTEVATFHRVCRDHLERLQRLCREDVNLEWFRPMNTWRRTLIKVDGLLRNVDSNCREAMLSLFQLFPPSAEDLAAAKDANSFELLLPHIEQAMQQWKDADASICGDAVYHFHKWYGESFGLPVFGEAEHDLFHARTYLTNNRQAFAGSLKSPTWKGGKGKQTEDVLKARWLRIVDHALPWWSKRLQGVFIANSTYAIQLATFNDRGTFAYLDPPYYFPTRGRREKSYRHELTDTQHVELLQVLLDFKGKVAVSGYPSRLYDSTLTRRRGWRRAEKRYRTNMDGEKGSDRLEVVWRNY